MKNCKIIKNSTADKVHQNGIATGNFPDDDLMNKFMAYLGRSLGKNWWITGAEFTSSGFTVYVSFYKDREGTEVIQFYKKP